MSWTRRRLPVSRPSRRLRVIVRPLGERRRTSRRGSIARRPSRSSTPSSSSAARQRRAGPRHLTLRHRAEVAHVRAPHRLQVDGADDAAPVPPALGQVRVLAAVHDHGQLVDAPGPQPASVHVERGVRVGVAADAAAVQEHGGLAADALEADPPAEPPRRLGPGELDPVAAHAAGVERGERARVEHARHLRGPPGRVHARGAARRRVGGGGRLALRRGLLRRGRLRRCGRGGVGAHLPSRRERHARRRRRGRGRGGHDWRQRWSRPM